jgi:hypothetical protein
LRIFQSFKNQKQKQKIKREKIKKMISIILIMMIGQSMAFPIVSNKDNERMERVESAIYELLNIIKFSDQLDVKENMLNKFQELDRERNRFLESRQNQYIKAEEIEKLFNIEFQYLEIIKST